MIAFLAAAVVAAQPATPNGVSAGILVSSDSASSPTSTTDVTFVPSPCCKVAKLTPVSLTIQQPLDSDKAQIGQTFEFRLAEPIELGGGRRIPAGIGGVGEVIHAAKSRAMGKPGELLLAARYLDWNGTRIPLRSFRFGKPQGVDNVGAAVAASMVSAFISPFITGGEVRIPVGANAWAKVAADLSFPVSTPAEE